MTLTIEQVVRGEFDLIRICGVDISVGRCSALRPYVPVAAAGTPLACSMRRVPGPRVNGPLGTGRAFAWKIR